jgi:hypothetical protein
MSSMAVQLAEAARARDRSVALAYVESTALSTVRRDFGTTIEAMEWTRNTT